MADRTVVTGYSKGLGRKVCERLDGTTKIVGLARTLNPDVWCSNKPDIDLSNYENIHNYLKDEINYINETNYKIALVLCAGTLGEFGGLLDSDLSDWENTLRTNLFGNLAVIKQYLPQMIKTQYGRIIFVSGGGAAFPFPEFSGYSISKVAIVREVENIAQEMRDKISDFSIIALAPGAMPTQMLDVMKENHIIPKTVVDMSEPVDFIENFLNMDSEKAKSLSGKFIHVRDNLDSDYSDRWLLRRTE